MLNVLTLALLLLIPASLEAHRLNWLPVRERALIQAEADAAAVRAEYPHHQVEGGIGGKCWRRSNHFVACPIYLRVSHRDHETDVVTFFVASVVARAHPKRESARFTHTPWRQL